MKHLVLGERTGEMKKAGRIFMALMIPVYLYTYFLPPVLVCVCGRERDQGRRAHCKVVQRMWRENLCVCALVRA